MVYQLRVYLTLECVLFFQMRKDYVVDTITMGLSPVLDVIL